MRKRGDGSPTGGAKRGVFGFLSFSLSPSRDGRQKGGGKRGQSVPLVLVGMGYKRLERRER